MIIYNLFVYIFIKDKDYLFYVLYQFVHMMFQISYLGLGYYFIWSYFPTIEKHSMPFILGIGCISVLIFSKSFLKIAKYNILNIIFIIFITINCMVTASTFANIYIPLIILNYLNLISILLMIISAFYCIKKGFSSAWYFVISWMVFLAGSVLIVLKNLGIVESNYFTNYSMQFGSAIEVIVMSIALSDKINVMKQEKELAQEEVITIQRSYSDSLEKTVNERTYELEIERNKLHRRNKIMENEIALARKIQESLIPEGNPAAYISSMYKPMEEVGGDFYDFIKLDDSDRIGIFLSDVSGHGVHAAFITSMIKTILLQAGDRIYDPAGLLLYMNEVLQGQTAGNFVTAFYGIFNPDDSSLYYSNAGHNQPYIITPECVSQLQGGKNTAIAMFPNNMLSKANKKFLNFQEQVPSGSKLLLYTDGLVEARPVGEDIFFEYANMEDVFRAHAGVHCSDFLDILMQELTSFRKSDSFEDDICLICMDVE
ncbi:MAG TPA: 7TM diverse intracellular signaling domain-containing protein [Spirochaetota bacterium]|nr:7TM diverse intracellular signaling domain-containing protein [Spirochaetota bacterium]